MNDEKFADAVLKLSQEMGALQAAMSAQARALESHTREYARGREANLRVQEGIKDELVNIRTELRYKMDGREHRPLLFLNTIMHNWRLVLAVLFLVGGTGTVAAKWGELVRLLGGVP